MWLITSYIRGLMVDFHITGLCFFISMDTSLIRQLSFLRWHKSLTSFLEEIKDPYIGNYIYPLGVIKTRIRVAAYLQYLHNEQTRPFVYSIVIDDVIVINILVSLCQWRFCIQIEASIFKNKKYTRKFHHRAHFESECETEMWLFINMMPYMPYISV